MKLVQIGIYVPAKSAARMKAVAEKEGRSLSSWGRFVLEREASG